MIKYSKNYKSMQERIKRIPEYYVAMVRTINKTDAEKIITEFRAGISKNRLKLEPLSPITVVKKQRARLRKPETPLYGKGGNDPRAYKNMMILREGKKSFTIRPSNRMHHSKKLTLKHLFMIHEHGCIIKRGDRVIRIPARFALRNAWKNVLTKRKKRDYKPVKQAITKYINDGDMRLIKQIMKQGI